jgi:anti-anti-sigma regulatory factor
MKPLKIGPEFTIRTIEKMKNKVLAGIKKAPGRAIEATGVNDLDLTGLQFLLILQCEFQLHIGEISSTVSDLLKNTGFNQLKNKTN